MRIEINNLQHNFKIIMNTINREEKKGKSFSGNFRGVEPPVDLPSAIWRLARLGAVPGSQGPQFWEAADSGGRPRGQRGGCAYPRPTGWSPPWGAPHWPTGGICWGGSRGVRAPIFGHLPTQGAAPELPKGAHLYPFGGPLLQIWIPQS